MRKPFVGGNWKMFGTRVMADALTDAIVAAIPTPAPVDAVVFPPFPYLLALAERHGRALALGAQDVSARRGEGAFTGEVSASMLRDVGCAWTLVGHSETRHYHGVDDAGVAARFGLAREAGLTPVLCVGEILSEREAGQTEQVIARQLDAVLDEHGIVPFAEAVVAYEPTWAIGTGHVATPQQTQEVHAFIRSQLAKRDAKISALTRIVYGGSVKPSNADGLFSQPDVDGGLIGGASLVAADFLAICAAARRAA